MFPLIGRNLDCAFDRRKLCYGLCNRIAAHGGVLDVFKYYGANDNMTSLVIDLTLRYWFRIGFFAPQKSPQISRVGEV